MKKMLKLWTAFIHIFKLGKHLYGKYCNRLKAFKNGEQKYYMIIRIYAFIKGCLSRLIPDIKSRERIKILT